jgi:hypothetical protein
MHDRLATMGVAVAYTLKTHYLVLSAHEFNLHISGFLRRNFLSKSFKGDATHSDFT